MKRLLLLIIGLVSNLCIYAQTFEGIKLTRSANDFVDQLVKRKGYSKFIDEYDEVFLKKEKSTVYVASTTSGDVCYLENNILCDSSWEKIQEEYLYRLDSLRTYYGSPDCESAYFTGRYYHYRVDELTGIKEGFCNYYATWALKGVVIYVSIQYINEQFVINIEYINTKVC